MKKINYIRIVSILCYALFWGACDNMVDNYEKYLDETIYPGRIDSLRTYIGYQKVYLGWEAPEDIKSKQIVIKWGEEDSMITKEVTDTAIVTGLNDGIGYEFEVFSIDEFGNQSVKKTATAMPISELWVQNNLIVPTPIITPFEGNNVDKLIIKWTSLANEIMSYAGGLKYAYTNQQGKTIEGNGMFTDLDNYSDGMEIAELQAEEIYNINYSMRFVPIRSGTVCIDTISVNGEIQIVPKNYSIPPVYMLIESKGWDESSMIEVLASGEGMYYVENLDLKYGDKIRFFEKRDLESLNQYGYSHYNMEVSSSFVSADETDNIVFGHMDGTYDLQMETIAKKLIFSGQDRVAYNGLAGRIPGRIEAEDYNLGGDGIGYYDTSGGNSGKGYREDNVDISSGPGSSYNVGWTSNGEWLEYKVFVAEAGTYRVDLNVASPGGVGTITWAFDGQDLLTYVPIKTGSWSTFVLQDSGTISLQAGVQTLRIKEIGPAYNLDAYIFTKISD